MELNNRMLGLLRDAGTGYEVRISEEDVVKVVEADKRMMDVVREMEKEGFIGVREVRG